MPGWRVEGQEKSGKTAVAIALTIAYFLSKGYKAYSNMRSCRWHGVKWAETITIDDVVEDVYRPIRGTYDPDGVYHPSEAIDGYDCECGQEHARIVNGVVLLDEAHNWIDPSMAGSHLQGFLRSFFVQAAKRGLLIIYTVHLATMVNPTIRNLTQMVFKCRKFDQDDPYIHIAVYDQNEIIEAEAFGYAPPRDRLWTLYGPAIYPWYDRLEPIDPFSFVKSKYTSATGRRLAKVLGKDQAAAGQEDMRAAMMQLRAELEGLIYTANAGGYAPRPRGNPAANLLMGDPA